MSRSAAVLLIGNELLSGKVQDSNLAFLAQELFVVGISVRRAVVCEDDVSVIARELSTLRTAHDIVFTTGGVGPTHDDVTLEAVATVVGQPLVRDPATAAIVADWCGGNPTEAHLRLALVPAKAELLSSDEAPWPTVFVEGIVVLPGVPEVVRRKWGPIRDRLNRGDSSDRLVSRAVYCLLDEFALADALRVVDQAHPTVTIGSYLQWDPSADHRTKITFDGRNEKAIARARDAFLERIPSDSVVRTE